MLRAKAEASRGSVTITIPSDDAPSTGYPRTTVRDAFSIALVFDAAIHHHAPSALAGRWAAETETLASTPEHSSEVYLGNRSLWEILAIAAIELDRAHVAPPPPALIEDAMRALGTTPRDPGRTAEDDSGTLLVTVLTAPTWQAMFLRQLEFFRVLRGETLGDNLFMPSVPRTSNADVLALATYWADQLAAISDGGGIYRRVRASCWREVLHQVMHRARRGMPHDTFAHNAAVWTALLLIQHEASDAAPMPWAFHVAAPGEPTARDARRNAGPVDTGATLEFPAAQTWDEAAQMQRDAFAKLRGMDRVTGRLIGRVPRTTIADVRQLAAYWSSALSKVGEHNFADVSYRHVIERWKAAVADVDRIPAETDPQAVYGYNIDFWEALMSIAIQVAVTAEAPTRWQLVKEATRQAVAELPKKLAELPNTLKTSMQDLVVGPFAKPLLYVGVGLGGLALAIYLLQRPNRESRS
ncbi:MAG TPA: hypothetical protein VFT22_15270 [Kofleriaceae bacterium]|nr:hypothetical protein [Kofleriaceae bacterium]